MVRSGSWADAPIAPGKGGCGARKASERELLAELLPRLYPGRRWGEPDDAARYRAGFDEGEGRRLGRLAAGSLEAPTWFRPGAPDECCDYLYVLCVGRQPGIVELRDADALEVPDGDVLREKYLRAALSSVARVAAVQEVDLELDREGDVWVARERPRAGVYDPILLKRTRKLVDLLVEAGATFLDFGLIERPPEGFDPGDYPARYGAEPGIVNYLFYPQPPTAVSTTWIPCASSPSPSPPC